MFFTVLPNATPKQRQTVPSTPWGRTPFTGYAPTSTQAKRRNAQAPRSTAPVRSTAAATAASRAAEASSAVSVRSGARKRSA